MSGLFETQYTGAVKYTIKNCHWLKYLCYESIYFPNELPLSSINCHLKELCVKCDLTDLSVPSANALSAHGDLEHVVLFLRLIALDAATTLIKNSPNLVFLYIVAQESLCYKCGLKMNEEDFKDEMSEIFSYHKLFTTGNFIVVDDHCQMHRNGILGPFRTDLSFFWIPKYNK